MSVLDPATIIERFSSAEDPWTALFTVLTALRQKNAELGGCDDHLPLLIAMQVSLIELPFIGGGQR